MFLFNTLKQEHASSMPRTYFFHRNSNMYSTKLQLTVKVLLSESLLGVREININFQFCVCEVFYSLKFSYNVSWSYLPLPGSVGLDSDGANGSRNEIGKDKFAMECSAPTLLHVRQAWALHTDCMRDSVISKEGVYPLGLVIKYCFLFGWLF